MPVAAAACRMPTEAAEECRIAVTTAPTSIASSGFCSVMNSFSKAGLSCSAATELSMDGDSLLFFLPPFTLSTTDDEARIIRLWLGDYADLLPENVTTDSAAPAKNDSPAGAA